MRAHIALLIGLLWLPLAQAVDTHWAPWRAEGLDAYERGHYTEAAACFRRAAEAGDARSAEILALMYRFGPWLFPEGVPVDGAEAGKWAAVAADARRREAVAGIATR
jgi:TPR repeat protein